MTKSNKSNLEPDKKLAAVCGLFCPSCTVYIGTREEPPRLNYLAQQMGRSLDELKCQGCRSETVCFYCKSCVLKECADSKGVDFCSQCPDHPCEALVKFQSEAPHRAESAASLDRIKSLGWEKWFSEMSEMSACEKCGTINSAYDKVCRSCGHGPSSPFGEKHKSAIENHLKKRGS